MSSKCCSFKLFSIHLIILRETGSTVSTKILNSKTAFSIYNNKKYHWAQKQQIRLISEGLCNTEYWSNGCWKFSFAITRINYIIKHIKIENNYLKLYKYFKILLYCILAALVNKSDFFHKYLFLYLTNPKCLNIHILRDCLDNVIHNASQKQSVSAELFHPDILFRIHGFFQVLPLEFGHYNIWTEQKHMQQYINLDSMLTIQLINQNVFVCLLCVCILMCHHVSLLMCWQ